MLTALYDEQGVFRFAGQDSVDCLAYAELFDLQPDRYSLLELEVNSSRPSGIHEFI